MTREELVNGIHALIHSKPLPPGGLRGIIRDILEAQERLAPRKPKRIQMSRQHPWRKEHPDAIIVDRRSALGNPFIVGEQVDINCSGEIAQITMTPEMAVASFESLMADRLRRSNDPDEMEEDAAYVERWYATITALAGHDLACWCALDQPCHADVLLELANPARRS